MMFIFLTQKSGHFLKRAKIFRCKSQDFGMQDSRNQEARFLELEFMDAMANTYYQF